MDTKLITSFCHDHWDNSVVPELIDYIRIPNKSPAFDPNWQTNGFIEKVVTQFTDWIKKQNLSGLQLNVIRLPERTPLIYIEIDGNCENTVLLYGHLDKQPEMIGWRDGLGPWDPVLDDDKLYGRGGADDGFIESVDVQSRRVGITNVAV